MLHGHGSWSWLWTVPMLLVWAAVIGVVVYDLARKADPVAPEARARRHPEARLAAVEAPGQRLPLRHRTGDAMGMVSPAPLPG